jgi:hypothetical protein
MAEEKSLEKKIRSDGSKEKKKVYEKPAVKLMEKMDVLTVAVCCATNPLGGSPSTC